jgi:hypothetical protein
VNRIVDQRFAESLSIALEWIPAKVMELLRHVEFLVGTDPIFAGLHQYETTDAGRSYRNTAHCVYVSHQPHIPRCRRRTTVVLPRPVGTATIVHEIGHALDELLEERWPVKPVTKYAEVNRAEAFAEAFVAFCGLPSYSEERLKVYDKDRNYWERLVALAGEVPNA